MNAETTERQGLKLGKPQGHLTARSCTKNHGLLWTSEADTLTLVSSHVASCPARGGQPRLPFMDIALVPGDRPASQGSTLSWVTSQLCNLWGFFFSCFLFVFKNTIKGISFLSVLVVFLLPRRDTMAKAAYKRKHLIWGVVARLFSPKRR